MGFDYEYTREKLNGGYNVDHPERLDVNGEQISLHSEIVAVITENLCRIYCEDTKLMIFFDTQLTGAEKALLDAVVGNHKTNS